MPDPETIQRTADARLSADVRRYLGGHLGGVEIADVSAEGEVRVVFTGRCEHCPALPVTFATNVLPALEQVAGVRRVVTDRVQVSDAALRRIRKVFGDRYGSRAPSIGSDA